MNTVSSFSERIIILMETLNLKKTDIAKACNINRSNFTRYCSGAYQAKQDTIYAICEKYNVNPAWLMGYDEPMWSTETAAYQIALEATKNKSGTEEIIRLTEDEQTLLDLFRMLPEELHQTFLIQLRALAEAQRQD